jgi:cytochrome c553
MKRKTLAIASALCLAPIGAALSAEGTSPAGDIAAGKAVAAASCAACHGTSGISSTAGIPHIAGQHASYIQGTLIAYQKGARKDDRMHQTVAQLSEQDIADVAAYYAGLESFSARPN